MKFSLSKRPILLVTAMLCFSIGTFAQNMLLNMSNVTVKQAMNELKNKSGYSFVYSAGDIDTNRKVDIKAANVTDAINQILDGQDLTYEFQGKNIVVKRSDSGSHVEPSSLKGKVLDVKGVPLVGASVIEVGTTNGAQTDVDGNFEMVTNPNAKLAVSSIGFVSQTISVADRSYVEVILLEDRENLDEVVVIGYGTSRKRDIVSAVSTVKGSTISQAATSNVVDILQGKVAGLDIQSSRYPGDNQNMYIRGVRSLNAGNSPLVIVDGVPGSLGSINTYDIESVDVLKDAASTAIYGSMGANGVILVTTKRGKKTQGREVNFNAHLGMNVPHMMDLMTGEQFVQFRRDGYRMAYGWNNSFTDEDVFEASELEIIRRGNYTDWMELLYKNSMTQSYHVSVNNSGEKTRLMISFKYDKEEGYYHNNDSENYNITMTADHDLTDFWTLGATVRLKRNNLGGFQPLNIEVLYMTPLCKPYNDDGSLNYFPNAKNTSGYNPLANNINNNYINNTQNDVVNANFTSKINIAKHISMTTNLGYIFSDTKRGWFYSKDSYFGKKVNSQAGKYYNNSDQWTLNHVISLDRSFGEHNIVVDIVGELQKYKYDEGQSQGDNQPVESTTYNYLASAPDNIQISSSYQNWALASVLGRIRYNYKNRYYLNVAFREDGSSRLASGKKWAFFPSGGASWSIKDETFMKGISWINNLKLRVSYGSVGNTAISPYQTLSTLSKQAYLFGESSSDKFYVYSPSSISNPDLGWEISRTTNLGIDFGFLQSKVNGYIEVYKTKTSDVLMQRTIPSFTGFINIWQNIGETETKGLEFNLNYSPIRKKDLDISLTLNASRSWEEIKELISGEDLPNNKWFIGHPLGVQYDYKKIGIWQLDEAEDAAKYSAVPGDIKVKDQNNDGAISAADDKIILGQTRPKWLASLGANITWKCLDFGINLYSRWGHLIHPSPYNEMVMDGQRWVLDVDYWTPENPTNDYQSANQALGYDNYMGANGYMKGDFIKIQDLTLGYSFEKIVSKFFPIKKFRLYMQMRNIAYIYKAAKYDIIPEQPNINYTIPATYNFGVNITF